MRPEFLAELVAGAIKQAITPLVARVKALESRPLVKYAGTWTAGQDYSECALVTHQGGLWVATEATPRTPGTEASGWRLIVKKGQA